MGGHKRQHWEYSTWSITTAAEQCSAYNHQSWFTSVPKLGKQNALSGHSNRSKGRQLNHPVGFPKWTQGKEVSLFLAEKLRSFWQPYSNHAEEASLQLKRVKQTCRDISGSTRFLILTVPKAVNPALPAVM